MSCRSGDGKSRPNLIDTHPAPSTSAVTAATAGAQRMAGIITRPLGTGQSRAAVRRTTSVAGAALRYGRMGAVEMLPAVETFTEDERRALAPYVTSLDGPVFA